MNDLDTKSYIIEWNCGAIKKKAFNSPKPLSMFKGTLFMAGNVPLI